jgi:hemolysin activation/secretion protein
MVMDNTRNDLIWYCCIPAWSQYFNVLLLRRWIGRLGLLLISILACYPAVAQQDRPTLRLLVLGSDPRPIQPAQPLGVQPLGVQDAAVPALGTPAARTITAAFIGRPIDDTLITDIRNRLAEYYHSIGRPFVEIAIPAQDIGDGTLRVTVIETKRGRLRVEGNRWFDDGQYLGAIRMRRGDPIDTRSLAADVEWINRDENRHATIAVEPGDDPSTYDLIVRAKDSLPLNATLAADNTGTPDTGLYRIGLAVDWTNALWRGDDLSYGLLTSPDQFRLVENALSYTAYLPWRDWVTISVVDANTRGQATGSSDGFSVNGHASIVSFRYSISLPAAPAFNQHIDLGYDFKTTNNNVLAGGNSVFPTISELDQFVVGYSARLGDVLGATGATATLVGSPGRLTSRNTQAALAGQQPGASPSYVYGHLSVERLTEMPVGMAWDARLAMQYSSDNLLPSEQLVFGGIQSIRGFVEQGATRDEGILMQNELRLARVEPGLFRGATGSLVPFVFLDLGAGRNHVDMPDMPRSWLEMVSAGPGATWHFTPNAALRLSWGFPVIRNGHTGPFLGPQFGTQISF